MTNFSSNLTAAEQEARSWRRLLFSVFLTAVVALIVGARTNPKGMLFLALFMVPLISWFWFLCHWRVHLAVARREEEQEIWPLVQEIDRAVQEQTHYYGGTVIVQRLPEYDSLADDLWRKAVRLYMKKTRDKGLRYEVFDGMNGEQLDTIWRARMVGGEEAPHEASPYIPPYVT